jgi:hypothetical protein
MAILKSRKTVPHTIDRAVVINDIKLFAQADCENEIDAYVTSDSESEKMYNALKQNTELSFSFFDIKISCHEAFGFLPLKI